MRDIFAGSKDNEQGLKTGSAKWGYSTEFEGSLAYMEGLVSFKTNAEKKEGMEEGWMEREKERRKEKGRKRERRRKPCPHSYGKHWCFPRHQCLSGLCIHV